MSSFKQCKCLLGTFSFLFPGWEDFSFLFFTGSSGSSFLHSKPQRQGWQILSAYRLAGRTNGYFCVGYPCHVVSSFPTSVSSPGAFPPTGFRPSAPANKALAPGSLWTWLVIRTATLNSVRSQYHSTSYTLYHTPSATCVSLERNWFNFCWRSLSSPRPV